MEWGCTAVAALPSALRNNLVTQHSSAASQHNHLWSPELFSCAVELHYSTFPKSKSSPLKKSSTVWSCRSVLSSQKYLQKLRDFHWFSSLLGPSHLQTQGQLQKSLAISEVPGGQDEWLLAACCPPFLPSGIGERTLVRVSVSSIRVTGISLVQQFPVVSAESPKPAFSMGKQGDNGKGHSWLPTPPPFPCSFPCRILPQPYHIPSIPLIALWACPGTLSLCCCRPLPSRSPHPDLCHGVPSHCTETGGRTLTSHLLSSATALKNMYSLPIHLCSWQHHTNPPSSWCYLFTITQFP